MTPPHLIIIETHRNVVLRFVACRRGVGEMEGRWRGRKEVGKDGTSLDQYFTLTPPSYYL